MRSAAGPQRTFARAPADMAEVLRERLAVRGGKAIGFRTAVRMHLQPPT